MGTKKNSTLTLKIVGVSGAVAGLLVFSPLGPFLLGVVMAVIAALFGGLSPVVSVAVAFIGLWVILSIVACGIMLFTHRKVPRR